MDNSRVVRIRSTTASFSRTSICAALDGTTANDVCDFPAANKHEGRKIVIVTESLGSRMVFDAITALKIEAERKGEESLAAFDEAVSPITQIYMLANQLPIFALARPAPSATEAPSNAAVSPTPSMVTALTVLSNARARHRTRKHESSAEGKLSLIAFTDPNDLLSYRLPPGDAALVGSETNVVNVITSNSDTYVRYAENPLPAHTDYNLNSDALRLLFGGSERKR